MHPVLCNSHQFMTQLPSQQLSRRCGTGKQLDRLTRHRQPADSSCCSQRTQQHPGLVCHSSIYDSSSIDRDAHLDVSQVSSSSTAPSTAAWAAADRPDNAAPAAAVAEQSGTKSWSTAALAASQQQQQSGIQYPPYTTPPQRGSQQQQQQQQQQLTNAASNSSSSLLGVLDSSSSRKTRPKSILGGTYTPGAVWHIRRRTTGGAAAPSFSPAAASYSLTQTASPGLLAGMMSGADVELLDDDDIQQQQQQQELTELPEVLLEDDMDFTLLERVSSHAAASTSGQQHTTSSSSSNSSTTSSLASQQQLQQQQGSADVSFEELLVLSQLNQRTASANFKDERFEAALSRWMKEAPDWFKIRAVFERYPQRFNIIHVTCALSCLADKTAARLTHKQVLRVELSALRAFLGQLLDAASRQLPSIDSATAAALLHSLARLANTGKLPAASAPELVSALLLHIEPYLSTLQPRHLAQLVWALKQLQHQPTQSWCESLFAQTRPLVSQLKGFEAALLLRGLAVIQSPTPPAAWSSAVLSHTEGLLSDMDARHISLLLLGLGGLKVQPSRGWLSEALTSLQSKFDSSGPQALSNTMWAFVQLGVLPDRSWLTDYFKTSLQLLDSRNRQELSLDMLALSKLRLEPGDQWLDEYFDATEAQLGRFTLRDLAIVGYAVAKLGLRPPQTWLRRYCGLLLQHKAGLYCNKVLLTQVMVALDSFKVPRMDMWRREMYAAAGYRLYKYPNWRQRVRVQPSVLAAGFSRRRFSRRPGSRAGAIGASSSSRLPAVLRSGDWGVMDAMGGAGGVLGGSMSSYEELAPAAAAGAAGATPASAAGVAPGGGRAGSGAGVKRPLPSSGLVRPQRPAPAAGAGVSPWSTYGSNTNSMAEAGGGGGSNLSSVSD